MRYFHRWMGSICVSVLLGACSTQAWYEGFRVRAQNECNAQPPGAREDCLTRVNRQPHDQYEKERAARP